MSFVGHEYPRQRMTDVQEDDEEPAYEDVTDTVSD